LDFIGDYGIIAARACADRSVAASLGRKRHPLPELFLPKIHLVLLIHAHQPVGNFDRVFEKVYGQAYLPFLERLERHPAIRLGLHYTGPLLEWLEQNHAEFLDRLGALVARGQVEMVGGGFYEPVLVAIPPADQLEQLRRMREYLERRFGQPPAGAWLTERVWEPQLPSALAAGGVGYTLLDDMHFLAAGLESEQLFGYYITEDGGACVKVIPGLKTMRYLVPFRPVEDVIAYLQQTAGQHPGGMVAMGDDCEKFGAWPGTYEHCYRSGWLDRFFDVVERNAEWLMTTPPGEYLAAHAPLGRADLPAASYFELMEWVLPTAARRQLHALQQEFGSRPEVAQFLRGGIWRGFLSKYAEANLLHKKALYVSHRLRRTRARKNDLAKRGTLEQARSHVLRAQCNDAYWHGIFGGLYAPHLRAALWRELARAEAMLDGARARPAQRWRVEKMDFDADGSEEFYLSSPQGAALVKPNDGATVPLLDFGPSGVTVINSLMRRPEAYHARLADASHGRLPSTVSIHEQIRVKEDGLERLLRYDRWPRYCFRLLLFPRGKSREDYEWIRLGESASLAAGEYRSGKISASRLEFTREAPLDLLGVRPEHAPVRVQKNFRIEPQAQGFSLRCSIRLMHTAEAFPQCDIGLETVLNLLAPDKPDRYFAFGMERHPLRWSGTAKGPVRLADEWQNVAVELEAPGAEEFWIAPIETVSESEEGFERVYQGSQILPVWRPQIAAGELWSAELILRLGAAHQ
jgi:4-alpha-glucanotransferase